MDQSPLPRIAFITPLLVAAALATSPVFSAPREVDLALVLAVDVSSSVSAAEHRIQIEGYVAAFRSRSVVNAIADGANGVIAVTLIDWANSGSPIQRVDWTLIDGAGSAEVLAARIAGIPYRSEPGTSIGGAIEYAHYLLDHAPCRAVRRVIDISGDGESTDRYRLARARERAIAARITINGLPIRDESNLGIAEYYATKVIGGPGAFIVAAESFQTFGEAIRRKLIVEIADLAPRETLLARYQPADDEP